MALPNKIVNKVKLPDNEVYTIVPQSLESINETTSAKYEVKVSTTLTGDKTLVTSVNNTFADANGDVSITLPTVNNATLTIQKNGVDIQTFTANSATDATANIEVPTDTSDLTNGAGFITGVAWGDVTDKPNFATVATTGSYTDLSNKPAINNATLTIQQNGTSKGTFTANSATDATVNIVVPTKTSDLTNDDGFITGVAWNDVTDKPTFATVATTGDYDDLDNTPNLATVATSGSYTDLTNRPSLATVATSGDYTDLSNTPNLATVATSGSYTDLTNRPSLATVATSGDYDDLTNKPELGTAAALDVGTSSGDIPVLDSNGKLNTSVLPAIAVTDTYVVANQAAMLALDAQVGDIAVRTDENKSYILKTAGASTLANWQELLTPTDTILSVNGQTGTVVLATDDISDANQTNKYTTAAEKATIAKIGYIEVSTADISSGSFTLTANQLLEVAKKYCIIDIVGTDTKTFYKTATSSSNTATFNMIPTQTTSNGIISESSFKIVVNTSTGVSALTDESVSIYTSGQADSLLGEKQNTIDSTHKLAISNVSGYDEETWTFTLSDGTEVTKTMFVKSSS